VPGTSRRRPEREHVPWRIIFGTIGAVIVSALGVLLVWELQRVLTYVVVAGFFAVVLNPLVTGLSDKLHLRRGVATTLVFLAGALVFTGLAILFIRPLYNGGRHLLADLPDLVTKTEQGKGSVGRIVARYHLQRTVQTNAPKLRQALTHAGGPALAVVSRVIAGVAGLVTILVLAFLMLLETPRMVDGALAVLDESQQERVRGVAQDVGRAVTGYVAGNLATSTIAGSVVYVTLLLLHVPFAPVFGVWVAMVDLLPLVGGLLAGVPTVAFAFLHSVRSGIVALAVFLVYQQVENHVLNPVIMSKTVRLNPLWVLLSVLVGAQLAGIVGALLAIPAAGAIQVIARDMWDHRRGRLKAEPTVGESETPVRAAATGD